MFFTHTDVWTPNKCFEHVSHGNGEDATNSAEMPWHSSPMAERQSLFASTNMSRAWCCWKMLMRSWSKPERSWPTTRPLGKEGTYAGAAMLMKGYSSSSAHYHPLPILAAVNPICGRFLRCLSTSTLMQFQRRIVPSRWDGLRKSLFSTGVWFHRCQRRAGAACSRAARP